MSTPETSVRSAPSSPAAPTSIGRIPVLEVQPVVEHGQLAAKASVGERLTVSAKVFREGHDAVAATVVLTAPDGTVRTVEMHQVGPLGLDDWAASVRLDAEGDWTFRIEGWSDPWHTWLHVAEIKWPAGIDVELVRLEAVDLLTRGATAAAAAGDDQAAGLLTGAVAGLRPDGEVGAWIAAALNEPVRAAMETHRPRELVSPTREFPLFADRERARFSSWYSFFPRSCGAHWDEQLGHWVSGTFATATPMLEHAAALGFDVAYLTPIHPIGRVMRKGPNNTLTPGEHDPGSPYAIGAAEGGHDAIHPDLGTIDDFDAFVARATELGLEVALDLALQAAPDHPWVSEHPELFSTRLDGTIAYAENPPKKYQDIYPINFDNDPAGSYAEMLRIVRFWMDHGVRIFRVDNPHTKPVDFWVWLLAEIRRTDPDVLFLAEAFTRPEMMKTLGRAGFHQSYSYFTWRTEKWELEEYLAEISTGTSDVMRPNFWPNTHDINPFHLQSGLPAAFAIRAVLASTMNPNWGIYSGFELCEHAALAPGREEYLDSEKYQYRPRDYDAHGNLNLLIGRLNEIRRQHPALQQLRDTRLEHAHHGSVIAYSRIAELPDGGLDRIIVVCSLDPEREIETEVVLDLAGLGLADHPAFEVRDELGGGTFWWGAQNFVRLGPAQPAHVLHVLDPAGTVDLAAGAPR